jgi:hypothetical protein
MARSGRCQGSAVKERAERHRATVSHGSQGEPKKILPLEGQDSGVFGVTVRPRVLLCVPRRQGGPAASVCLVGTLINSVDNPKQLGKSLARLLRNLRLHHRLVGIVKGLFVSLLGYPGHLGLGCPATNWELDCSSRSRRFESQNKNGSHPSERSHPFASSPLRFTRSVNRKSQVLAHRF